MDESFDESIQREQEAMDCHPAGKGRKRKKQYYKTIRQQMEFYFGDANLSKDRFLTKMIAADPCKLKINFSILNLNIKETFLSVLNSVVPLSTFMSFNKIKELTNSIGDLQKAIDGSELLELSGDKQSIRRTTEVQQKENIDEYVVYVVGLIYHYYHSSIVHTETRRIDFLF